MRNVEATAELAEFILVEFLLLMGDVAAFAGFAHAVAFDGLGENNGGPAFMFHRGVIGGVNFHRIVAAAQQLADLVIGEMIDHRQQFRIFAEEMFARVASRLDGIFLIIAVDGFFHAFEQQALVVAASSGSQSEPQMTLMTFQPAPRKSASSS